MGDILYTIGHSNVQADDLLKLLIDKGIKVLVDVRSIPHSEYTPWFDKDELARMLDSNNIMYLYMGDLLGGKPADKSCYRDGRPDYNLIREKNFYQKGIERLVNGIVKYPVAIMCSEEDPIKCHRRNLIGLDMYKKGVKIIHIRHNGALQEDDFKTEMLLSAQGSLFA